MAIASRFWLFHAEFWRTKNIYLSLPPKCDPSANFFSQDCIVLLFLASFVRVLHNQFLPQGMIRSWNPQQSVIWMPTLEKSPRFPKEDMGSEAHTSLSHRFFGVGSWNWSSWCLSNVAGSITRPVSNEITAVVPTSDEKPLRCQPHCFCWFSSCEKSPSLEVPHQLVESQ